jgi:hypothetical protein
LILILATAVLSAKGRDSKGGRRPSVETLVLALNDEELKGCDRKRYQCRQVRSVGAGSFTLKYQTGRRDGVRIRPRALDAVIAPGTVFAYDVVEEVVRLRYVQLRQREEVRTDLAAKGVRMSSGSVSNLSWEGLAGLQCLHVQHAGQLAEHYRRKAFVLHMDGTREGGDWTHFVLREGLTGHVILSRKIRSEHSADIEKILREVKSRYGTPDCIVSDMSAAICNAVEAVFRSVPHRLCHYHFLKAIGKVMLGDDHDGLGTATRRATKQLRAIRRSLTSLLRQDHELARPVIDLIDHIVSNTADLKAEGFPFDLPNLHYYARCEATEPVLERFLRKAIQRYGCSDPAVACMRDLREQIRRTTEYLPYNPVKRLRRRFAEFEAFRSILRPATVDQEGRKAPLNWGMLPEDISGNVIDIAGPLRQFRDKARRMAKRKSLSASDRKMWKGIRQRVDRYADRLDPILNVRGKTILLPRTNNLSETGFRDFKRRLRRTTGNGDLSRQLDHTPAEAFYVENLSRSDYTRIVFGGRTMAEALADVDRNTIHQAVAAMKRPPAAGIIDHHFINRDDFYEAVQAKFSKILATKAK